MSYKYSKGAQVIGDLKAADDVQRDTVIDFGEDIIDLQTAGASVLKVSGSDVYLANGSNIYLTGTGGIYFDSDAARDVFIKEEPTNNMLLDGNNRIFIRADQNVFIQENTNTLANFDLTTPMFKLFMPMSSSYPLSASTLYYSDSIKIIGAPAGQETIVDNQGNFTGNSIDVDTVSGSNIVVSDGAGGVEYKLPTTDGAFGQAIITDGSGRLSFSTISGGGGGGVAGSSGTLFADPDLTWDGSELRAGGDFTVRDETFHENYSSTKYPSNQSNTGSYANKKAFIKELYYTKYNFPNSTTYDLFTIEPHDERTGSPSTAGDIYGAIGIDITVVGHFKGVNNVFSQIMGSMVWVGGPGTRGFTQTHLSAIANPTSPTPWFGTKTTGSNGLTLQVTHQAGGGWTYGPITMHIKIYAGYPADNEGASPTGRYIYWEFTEHFNEPSE
jgi:hypothetical protein